MCENGVEGVERSLKFFNCYSCYSRWKNQKWCLWLLCNTIYRVMLLILLMLKGQKCTLYTAPLALQGGRLFIWKAFHLVGLAVHQQSVRGGNFNFLGLVNYKVIAGKMHSQSPILKTAPYSPESNYSYLALIWSVKELYSLWASCTVNK